ncbi:hypothetical protein H4R99_003749 [Coemansia sp. RSA 1722]|nr:hypothetical protein IWW45_003106 [Coemansia sp. RSA 485]KAJ2599331.1 hypothetical protein H4R99_003749 [Coemansia sp. RSA 1722]
MKFQLSVSVLIAALTAYAQAASIAQEISGGFEKRGMFIGDQPLVVAEETPAHTTADVLIADDSTAAAVAAAGQVAQPQAVLLDTTAPSIRGSSLGFIQVQQAPVSPQLMFSPGLGNVGALQRVIDSPQVVVQAQPAAASAGAVTVVQAISFAPAATAVTPAASVSIASVVSAVPVTSSSSAAVASTTALAASSTASLATSTSASQATVTVTAAASAVSSAVPVTTTVSAVPAVVTVAPAPAAAAAAPPAPVGLAAPAAQLAYTDPTANQPVAVGSVVAGTGVAAAAPAAQAAPVVGAAAADQLSAPSTFAQQQLYPAAVGAAVAPAAQAAVGAIPTAMILGTNPNAAPVIISADPQLTDLLTQAALAATPAAAGATDPTVAADDDEAAADAGLSAASAVGLDNVSTAATLRRSAKTAGRNASHHGVGRKAKATSEVVDDSAADSVDILADSTADATAAAEEEAGSVYAPASSKSAAKGKSVGKASGKKAVSHKSAAAATVDADANASVGAGGAGLDSDIASVANTDAAATLSDRFHATASIGDDTPSADGISEVDSAVSALAGTEAEPSFAHAPGSRQRGSPANLKEEAAKARAEASAEAREAVLSEIRAEASAEAALQASSELHLNGRTIVHDEAAHDDYFRDQSQSSYAEDSQHTGTADSSDTSYGMGGAKYSHTYNDDVSYGTTQSSPYHVYDTYSDTGSSSDYYTHGHGSYSDDSHECSSHGDWKLHYDGANPTVYQASEGSNYYNYNSEPHSYTNGGYNVRYSDRQSDGEYEHGHYAYDSQTKPFNFVNMHADSALARDASSATASAASSGDAPRAVDELDPLSYATEACSFRKDLPLVATESPVSACPSIMVIGVPQPTMMPAPASSIAPQPSTVMVTKMITPAVKVVVASNSGDSD